MLYVGPEVAVPIVFFGSITATVLGVKWINMKRELHKAPGNTDALQNVENRLARVEVALDDLSVELGRVAEGQQFLTKVLTERQRESLPPPGSR